MKNVKSGSLRVTTSSPPPPTPTDKGKTERGSVYERLERIVLCDVTLNLCNLCNLCKFLYFPRRRRACFSKQSTKDNSLLLCIGYSFELICNSMHEFKCILCFKGVMKANEQFLNCLRRASRSREFGFRHVHCFQLHLSPLS